MNPVLRQSAQSCLLGPLWLSYVAFSTFRMEKMTSIQGTQLPIWLTEYIAAGVKSMMVWVAGSAACMNETLTQDLDPSIWKKKRPLRRPEYRGQNNTYKDIIHMEKEGVEDIMEIIREVLWTECGEFLQWLRNYHLLNDSDPSSQLLSPFTVN